MAINYEASWKTVPPGEIKIDGPHGIIPTAILKATQLTPEDPRYHRYVAREVALLNERMLRAGYWPLAHDGNGLVTWGGDWHPDPDSSNPEKLRKTRVWWAERLEDHLSFGHFGPDRWPIAATAVYLAWDRFQEIGGYRGPTISAMAGAEPASMEDLFYAWAGPRPPEAQPSAWYVQAWPIWIALGLYVLSGRKR